jgi:hypothetical protein
MLDKTNREVAHITGRIEKVKPLKAENGSEMTVAMMGAKNEEIVLFFPAEIWEKCCSDVTDGTIISVEGRLEYKENEDNYYCMVKKIVGEPVNMIADDDGISFVKGMTLDERKKFAKMKGLKDMEDTKDTMNDFFDDDFNNALDKFYNDMLEKIHAENFK